MKERPIIFSAESVRAILAGQKTQTRRVVKPTEGVCPACVSAGVPHNEGALLDADGAPNVAGAVFGTEPYLRVGFCEHNDRTGQRIRCPHGRAGDRLWVRETFAITCDYFGDRELTGPAPLSGHRKTVHYAADPQGRNNFSRWRSPIHMPRWASRLTLEIVSVRVERLQDISEEDATAEGFTTRRLLDTDLRSAWLKFAQAWNALHGAGAWEANPWVWRIEFRRLQP